MTTRTSIFLNNQPESTDDSDLSVYPTGRVYVITNWTRDRYLYVCQMLSNYPQSNYPVELQIDSQSFAIEMSVAQKVEGEHRIDFVNEHVEAALRKRIDQALISHSLRGDNPGPVVS